MPNFNKIHKTLIPTDGLKCCLMYAIDEIALVVIGILIALQIDNRNGERKEKLKKACSPMC